MPLPAGRPRSLRACRSRLRPSPPRRLLAPSRWTLRTRLLAALTSLLAAVCLVVALVTGLTMKHLLVDRLDAQLTAAGSRSVGAATWAQHGRPDGDPGQGYAEGDIGFLGAPGQAAGTLGARLKNGQCTAAGIISDKGPPTFLTSASERTSLAAVPLDGRPHTIAVGFLGSYRLLATHSPDGDVLVTGLPMAGVSSTLHQLAWIEALVAGLALLAALGAGAVIVRRSLRPLRRVAATATRVSELPLDRGEVALAERVAPGDTDARTEVGQVGAALNRLLGHVGAALAARHASETRVRQFVADASHELRTPLAAIRGYAELTRRSQAPVPPDVAYALQRVESEAGRMTTLVEDLLLLARLDSGRPVESTPVDLTRLVLDAVSDSSVAGPDHRWRLDLSDEPVTVAGDPARLHQVLANLLANARTHTPPGTTVTTSLTAGAAGQALLCVHDDGPGIPAELLPHVFERFARGERSRSRATGTAGSTGLGLAIVEAVVQAHGGSVEVRSVPGATAFVVQLPAQPPGRSHEKTAGVRGRVDAARVVVEVGPAAARG